ncbi:NAD(P)/FAD-dependent oxidoreductase [Taibaiella chishuiensis]|uniref:UDP-galactopyranose mutase n=1 Tax=Taibaiella chishuiensis TaxID=1434707 RepID=A0A2P8DB29_9BACT|nr:NAD(P)/FAD-dependent oxidoreductase [Taibaiella chishuiensis]PSK94409.1 UDP-galactopyranose mutase [Taibaiella chishuiensis]
MAQKIALIAGAGPAGLTAAYELLHRTDIIPIVYEKTTDIGGISKTINYKGNRIDIGGHRFFSKSDRVMDWWLHILPMEKTSEDQVRIQYQNKTRLVDTHHVETASSNDQDKIMLVRGRLSRIYFLKQFFSYPVTLSAETLRGLGLFRSIKIFFSYMTAQISPIKDEKSLEDFFINRFGKELYLTFFKDYTEKVWGIACKEISADWGAQRIKGLSIIKAIQHALKAKKKSPKATDNISQKETETSLIERFLYPKFGPGQMWEEVARQVEAKGGIIHMEHEVVHIHNEGNTVKAVTVRNCKTGEESTVACDYFFSTMPMKQLLTTMQPAVPQSVRTVAEGLLYRDFITVGLLMDKLKIRRDKKMPAANTNTVKDNWIYIQEREVKVGRLQIFNNWSPFMVANPDHVWIGMEYFCNEGDPLWTMEDEALKKFAIDELAQIEIIDKADVLDSTVLRMEKAYPAYFGTYNRFDELKTYTDQFENLFLVGRNGMHKYNNSDHSMLTAMTAVDNIIAGRKDKKNIWEINTEMEYHEEKDDK